MADAHSNEVFAKICLVPIHHGDPTVDVGAVAAKGRANRSSRTAARRRTRTRAARHCCRPRALSLPAGPPRHRALSHPLGPPRVGARRPGCPTSI
ncbi:hypothetical protein ZWY2020_048221 [Hordeum vulgare]|nr:hypothetical protein ZWY2020_048221 [Hordeum vulgare]